MDERTEQTNSETLNWDEVREKMNGEAGRGYWRSLDQLANSKEFQQWVDDEFPHRKSIPEIDRRNFMKLAGASALLSGLVGCRSLPREKLVPFVKDPEDRVIGKPQWFATSMPFAGFGFPVVATSHEGRPTKLDGLPNGPASGRSDAFVQCEILSFYDPERARNVSVDGVPTTIEDFYANIRKRLAEPGANRGQRVAILTETVTSPTLIAMYDALRAKYPEAAWYSFDAVSRESQSAAFASVFGTSQVVPMYDFGASRAILSLDGDFMAGSPHHVIHQAGFAKNRDPHHPDQMNRLYVVESAPTITGSNADHRIACKPSEVEAVAAALAARFGLPSAPRPLPSGVTDKWLDALVADLRANRGLIYVGLHQTPFVHAVAAKINAAIGAPVTYRNAGSNFGKAGSASLRALANALESGQVDTVIVHGGNPVYAAPSDIRFKEALSKAKLSVCISVHGNETSAACDWSVPEAHFLESWGDQIDVAGNLTIQQPLIAPLFDAHSAIEIFGALAGRTGGGEKLVRATWKSLGGEKQWKAALDTGYHPLARTMEAYVPNGALPAPSAQTGEFEVVFVPDPTVYDGDRANNGWLQELPKPLTKLMWDNAVHLSPETAAKLGVGDERKVKITVGSTSVEGAVFVQPGHPNNCATLHLGYGREGGRVLEKTGFNFMALRNSANLGFAPAQIEPMAGSYDLAVAQTHHSMEGRDIIREGSLAFYKEHPNLTHHEHHDHPTFYNLTQKIARDNPDLPQWAMAIDLNLCTGCNACVSACQSENNISVVGKLEAQRGRELHWIRIDRYYRVAEGAENRDLKTGAAEMQLGFPIFETNPGQKLSGPIRDGAAMDPNRVVTVMQPVTCMHCETAPCEPVCPVAATTHSAEGLNQMVYNRCVGTRYCSNNCPYKVRRFNYYNYQHGQADELFPYKDKEGKWQLGKPYGQKNFQKEDDKPLLRLLHNPDVTVRSRGVMEKCTYCVQRINAARITAKKERRDVKDGEVVTACQQACPTSAIVFGNMADPNTSVAKARSDHRNYSLLAEIGTNPRTTYLGKVRNPNPALEAQA